LEEKKKMEREFTFPGCQLGLKTQYLGFPYFEVTNLMDKEDYFIYLGNKAI
jgi:hypothetical protein